MAKKVGKKVSSEREDEILDYTIDKENERIIFMEDHGLSQKKIDKAKAKRDKAQDKKNKKNGV